MKKYKISDVYIEEGLRIRKEYLNTLKDILKHEDNINNYKYKIDNILDTIKQDDNLTVDTIKLKLMDIEKHIIQVENILNPLYEKLNNLENLSLKLHETILTIYPDIDIEDAKQQIIEKY